MRASPVGALGGVVRRAATLLGVRHDPDVGGVHFAVAVEIAAAEGKIGARTALRPQQGHVRIVDDTIAIEVGARAYIQAVEPKVGLDDPAVLLIGDAVEIDVITAGPLAVERSPAIEVRLINPLILIAIAFGLTTVL